MSIDKKQQSENNGVLLLGLIKSQIVGHLLLALDKNLGKEVLAEKYEENVRWRSSVQQKTMEKIKSELSSVQADLEIYYANASNQWEKFLESIIKELETEGNNIMRGIRQKPDTVSSVNSSQGWQNILNALKAYIRFLLEEKSFSTFLDRNELSAFLRVEVDNHKDKCFYEIRQAGLLPQGQIDLIKSEFENYLKSLKLIPVKNSLDQLRYYLESSK